MSCFSSDVLQDFKSKIIELDTISHGRNDFFYSPHDFLLGYYSCLRDIESYFDELCDFYSCHNLQFTPREKGFKAII